MRGRISIKSLTAFEVETLEQKLPNFKIQIDNASAKGADFISTATAFPNNPTLFYLAMLYASDRGITVILVPKIQFEREYEKS